MIVGNCGTYKIYEQIGSGGFSTVHRCADRTGRVHVCKKLKKSETPVKKVQKEVDILKKVVGSSNIVQFHDFVEDESAFYIVQECCEYGCVSDLILHETHIGNTLLDVRKAIKGVLIGLQHLHHNNIIHGDLNENNVFVNLHPTTQWELEYKIGDFGNSLMYTDRDCIEDGIASRHLVGTPWYFSPENLTYMYHPNSDIWSVGIMTYNMLYGMFPFDDHTNAHRPNMAVISRSIMFEDPKFPTTVEKEAIDFMKKCLEKSVEDRLPAIECLKHPWLRGV